MHLDAQQGYGAPSWATTVLTNPFHHLQKLWCFGLSLRRSVVTFALWSTRGPHSFKARVQLYTTFLITDISRDNRSRQSDIIPTKPGVINTSRLIVANLGCPPHSLDHRGPLWVEPGQEWPHAPTPSTTSRPNLTPGSLWLHQSPTAPYRWPPQTARLTP